MSHIEHFGVKGMHWGVRKSGTTKTATPAALEKKAARRQLYKHIAAAGAIVALGILHEKGPDIAMNIAQRAEFNRGRDAIPAIMDKSANLKYSKKRGGVYKVTTL